MLPVATYAHDEGGVLVVEAAVTSDDGARQVRARASGDPAEAAALGAGLAERLADLGAMDLLTEITAEAPLKAPDKTPEAPRKAPDKTPEAPRKAPDKTPEAPLKAPDKTPEAPLKAPDKQVHGAAPA
jgi:hypothetical protein